jgi:predicted ATPase
MGWHAAYACWVSVGDSNRLLAADRATVERTARDLVLGVVERRPPAGVSVVVEGAPGIGKTFLVREILASVAPGAAKVLRVAGQPGRRNDPFTIAKQLLGDLAPDTDPADAAFDHVDELCADGPVVLCADDAHHLDAASLTLLRRLVWASRACRWPCLSRPGRVRLVSRWPCSSGRPRHGCGCRRWAG